MIKKKHGFIICIINIFYIMVAAQETLMLCSSSAASEQIALLFL